MKSLIILLIALCNEWHVSTYLFKCHAQTGDSILPEGFITTYLQLAVIRLCWLPNTPEAAQSSLCQDYKLFWSNQTYLFIKWCCSLSLFSSQSPLQRSWLFFPFYLREYWGTRRGRTKTKIPYGANQKYKQSPETQTNALRTPNASNSDEIKTTNGPVTVSPGKKTTQLAMKKLPHFPHLALATIHMFITQQGMTHKSPPFCQSQRQQGLVDFGRHKISR